MRAVVVVVIGFVLACSNKSDSSQREIPSWCADELRTTIVPALDRTLAGGDADAFERDTAKFTQGTMCGPDIAALIRDWGSALREPDAAKSASRRRDVLDQLHALVSSQEDWKPEAKLLEPLFAKAHAIK